MFKIKDAWQIVENTEGIQTFTDVDGQQYRYKQFGTQIWMIDNYNRGGREGEFTTDHNVYRYNSEPVKTFRYKDVLDYQNWNSEYGLNRGAIYTYGNSTYGYVTDLIPSGWHIATQSDWETLISWANTEYPGFGLQALMAKTTYWCPQNPSSSVVYDNYDKSGFGIVPAGYLERSNNVWRYSDSAANSKAYFIIGDKSVILIEQAQNSAPAYSFPGNYNNWTWCSIRLVKDGGVPDPQPIITDIVTSLDSTGSDNKIATEKATRSAITSAVSSKMSNPMTTAGDLIVGGSSGAPSRLASGTQGQILKVGASGLEWGNEAGGAVQSVSDTDSIGLTIDQNGDLTADLKIDSSSGNVSLTAGSDGLYGEVEFPVASLDSGSPGILVSGNVDNEYTVGLALSSESDNILQLKDTGNEGLYAPPSELDGLITTAGDLIVGNASGVPSRLASGSHGQVLKVGASGLEWGNESSGMQNPMTTSGDIIVGGNSGTPSRLAQGTLGQVLKVGSNGPEWGTDEGMLNPMTSSNDLIIGGTSGAPNRLGAGSDRQILTVNGGTVMWENPLYALNADNPNDTYMFYTQFEDTNTRAGGGYENKLKTLGMNSASVGNILSLRAGTPVQSGMVPQNEPYWRTESDVFQSGHPMTAFGDIIYAGSTDSQGRRSALSLPAGTVGQVLGLEEISTIGVKPKWVDLPGTCQENFNICLSTKKENLTSNPDKLYAAKFISHETAKRTKLGFYHCTGIQGIVMMGIYDKLGNLIGQTGPHSFATEPDEEMLWYDTETPFTVTAGEEYWFVFWGGNAEGEYNMSLTVLQHDITQNFDPYIVGSCSYTSSKTTLPSTIPSLQYETTMCYMAVK